MVNAIRFIIGRHTICNVMPKTCTKSFFKPFSSVKSETTKTLVCNWCYLFFGSVFVHKSLNRLIFSEFNTRRFWNIWINKSEGESSLGTPFTTYEQVYHRTYDGEIFIVCWIVSELQYSRIITIQWKSENDPIAKVYGTHEW